MVRSIGVVCGAVVVLAGCGFDAALPGRGVVGCSAAEPACPTGYVCQAALGRCVSTADLDREAPRVVTHDVTPGPLRRGDVLRVAFTVSEALGLPPTLTLAQPGRSLRLTPASVDAMSFVADRRLDTDDLDGLATVSVDLVDPSGNVAVGAPLGVTTFDFTPPAVRSVRFVSVRVPDAGQLELRPNDIVTVRVSLTETVRAGARLEARSERSECGVVRLTTVTDRSDLVDFVGSPTGQSGCRYELWLDGVVDLAGNATEPGQLPLGVGYAVVGVPPELRGLEALRPADAGWTPASVFSRSAGFDQVGVRFGVSADAVEIAVRFDDELLASCGLGACAADADGGRACFCTRALRPADVEGGHLLSVAATNAAANVRAASVPVRFDFTPPGLVPGTTQLQLTPPAGSLLPTVSALGVGGSARVLFTTDEAAQASVAATPAGLDFTLSAATATSFAFTATGTAGLPQGPLALSARLTDAVGNAATVPLGLSVVVDTVAPSAPRTGLDAGTVYTRWPWGALDAGPSFVVTGQAGAVEPGAVVVATDLLGSEAGRASGDDAGAFQLALSQTDRTFVWLRAVDGAGNASAQADVKDVVWVATLAAKVPGSVLENPHLAEARPRFIGLAQTDQSVERTLPLTAAGVREWEQPAPFTGSWRIEHAMTFDAHRGRSVLFSGIAFGSGELWEWDGDRWLRGAVDGGPSPRYAHAMVYDAARRKVVLVGGSATINAYGDTWEWDGLVWVDRTPANNQLGLRRDHALAYDFARDRVVLFGGLAPPDVSANDDFFEWDGVRWARVAVDGGVGPPPMGSPAMVGDPLRRVVVLIGDEQTWEWNGARWVDRTSASSPPLGATAMAYDDAHGLVLAFGGGTTSGPSDLLWAWDGGTWSSRGGGPSARQSHAMAYDSVRQRLVVQGGATPTGNLNELWEFDGATWRNRTLSQAQPTARYWQAMAYDAARRRTVMHGGGDGSLTNNQTWEWDGTQWRDATQTVGPGALQLATMAFDGQRGRVALVGGNVDGLWSWSGTAWTNLSTTPAPSRRIGPTLAYDTRRARLVLFGGSAIGSDPLWEHDGGAWERRTPDAGPDLKFSGGMAFDERRGRCVHFGGTQSRETWEWDGTRWYDLTPPDGGPTARNTPGVAYDADRERVVLFGGTTQLTAPLGDLWTWDGARWEREEPPPGGPGLRAGHSVAYDTARHRLLTFGGAQAATALQKTNELWEYGFVPGQRPQAVLRFAFAYAGEPNAVVVDARVEALLGGNGRLLDGGVLPGASLATFERNGFVLRAQHAAPDAAAQWLSLTVSDPRLLADTFAGARRELAVALSPVGTNGATEPARVRVEDARLTVRYRRP